MIELTGYQDIEPPSETIRTEHVEKPKPDRGPVDIYEMQTGCFMRRSGVDKDDVTNRLKHRYVLFSGGDDSLALTHYAMSNGLADVVLHLDTGTAIPENISYIRNLCAEYQWPLQIIKSPMPFSLMAYRYGFPGPDRHDIPYNYLKGRQLAALSRHRAGDIHLISGVRTAESEKRKINISAEVQYADQSQDDNFSGWWVSPFIDKSGKWVKEYREDHSLPRNPVADNINRSGDCQCLAYGARFSELVNIESEYPAMAEWLRNVERRTMEYRGRVALLEQLHPDIYSKVDSIRDQSLPKPMRMTVLKQQFSSAYRDIVEITTERAIKEGKTMETCYLGHGGVSSDDMNQLKAEQNIEQESLCQNCGDGCPALNSVVEEKTEQARRDLNKESGETADIEQQNLVDDMPSLEKAHQIIEQAEDSDEPRISHEQVSISGF